MTTIPIYFQLDDQAAVPARLPVPYTRSDLQTIIKSIYKERSWKYSFVCHGKTINFDDEEDMEQIKRLIVLGTTLFAFTPVKGLGSGCLGSKFVDVSKANNLKKISWSPTAPTWRVARPGLCLEGECKNGKCNAYKQLVIANVGIKNFNLNREKKALSKCPECQQYVNPTTCAFNNCQWKYSGQIQREDDEPVEVSSEWTTADDAYYRFDEKEGESVNWLELVFETKGK